MLKLALDTATDSLSVALERDNTVLVERTLDTGRNHLELLLPEIHGMLNANEFQARDIGTIIVGTGPGAFSGLRVGIATARGLAQVLRVPLRGSSTLEALAKGIATGQGCGPGDLVLPVIDARRGQVFSRLYRVDEGGLAPETAVSCLDPAELFKKLEDAGEVVLAAGNGAVSYFDVFAASDLIRVPGRDEEIHLVRARLHFLSADEDKTSTAANIMKVVPVYIREPDADKTVLQRKKEPWLK